VFFHKVANAAQWGKESFQKRVLQGEDINVQNELGPFPYTIYKISPMGKIPKHKI
jgi:hypothetical protein